VKSGKEVPNDRTLQAKLLNQDSLELSTVVAKLLFQEGRCQLRPPEGESLEPLLAQGRILKISCMETWALENGKIMADLLVFDMKLIPNTDPIGFVERIPRHLTNR